MIKNLYLYLLFSGLVIAGITPYPVAQEATEYELKKSSLPEKKSQVSLEKIKTPAYLPQQAKVVTSGAKLLTPLITAKNSYTITNDQGLPGISAGDELEYTVTIANGGTEATGVVYESVLDPNITLVPNSIVAGPVAVNDNYNTIGNVGLDIPASQGVLANDANPGSSALVISTVSPITTAHGGTVNLDAATGAFTYSAPAGYNGSDTFTYTVGNGSGPSTTASVTIQVAGRIWFINSTSNETGGDGTLQKPFTSVTAFEAINTGQSLKAQNSDLIFIYTGEGNYETNLALREGQKIIGQGARAGLLPISGYNAPSGTNLLPSTSGTSPILISTRPSTNVITLGINNTIRGVDIGSSTGRKIMGNNFGKLVLKEVSLAGSGTPLLLNGGELDATFSDITATTSNVTPIQVINAKGKLAIASGTITANMGSALSIGGMNTVDKLNLNLQFTSLSSSNAIKGIELSNTSGSLLVSGTGTAGSGGAITNIAQRGVDLKDASGITLKYMTFNNANTTEGTPVTNGDNANCNGAIHANNVSGLTLENISIAGTTVQQGINLKGVSNFNLTNSSVVDCGNNNEQEEGCIYAVNTSGTSTILGSQLSKPSGRVAYFRNNNTNLGLLTVDNSEFTDAYNSAGFLLEGWGNSVMNLKVVNNSKFLKNQTTGVAVYANDNSIVSADIKNANIDPTNSGIAPGDVGLGIDIAASGSSKVNFNVLNNILKARGGNAVNVFTYQNGFGEGSIDGNTITLNEGGGAGIRVHNEGVIEGGTNLAHAVVKISNNIIGGVTSDSGIKISSTSLNSGKVDATVVNNTVSLDAASSNTSFYNIDVAVVGGGINTGKICANVANNIIPAGMEGELGIARFRAGGIGSEVLLQGATGSPATNWSGNGNTAGNVVVTPGPGNFTYGATCAVPANPALRVMAAESSTNQELAGTSSHNEIDTKDKNTSIAQTDHDNNVKPTIVSAARKAAALAGETVLIDGGGSGFTVPANQNIVIKYRVIINSSIPAGTCSVSSQGTVSGTGFTDVLTDDSSVSGTENPTETNVVSAPVFTSIPANVTRSLVGENCVSSENLPAVAASCPAPTVTYSVGGTPISFPYDFPTGSTTVDAVASNGVGTNAVTSYTVTVKCTALPVTLIQFSAKRENNTGILSWKTTEETNSEEFRIERSNDGKNWETIGSVVAKGESSSTVPYTYTDNNPVTGGKSNGENLYRLKMIDRDATFAYSSIVSLRFEGGEKVILYPNPVLDEIGLNATNWNDVINVEIYNIGGIMMYRSGKVPSDKISVKDFKSGSYIARIKHRNGSTTSYKFVVVR